MRRSSKGVDIVQERTPRFDRNLLSEVSNHPSRCVYIPPQAAAGVDFGGYPIILDCSYHLSKETFEQYRDKEPWPEATEETIVAEELGDDDEDGGALVVSNGNGPKPAPPTKRIVDSHSSETANKKRKDKS